MRVLFTTFAAKVHMYSQVPLAWALHTAGHEVRVASQPDLVDAITGTGLTAVPVGHALNLEEGMKQVDDSLGEGGGHEDAEASGEPDAEPELDITESRPERLTWDYSLGVFASMTAVVFQNQCPEEMIDDLAGFAREWKPDLVVWDTMTFAGAVAARACGAASARLLFGVDHVARMRAAFVAHLRERPPQLRDDPMEEWLSTAMRRLGCPGDFDEDMVVGQWTIDPTPSWMRSPLDLQYVPVRYVPYNGPATVPEWLREEPKRKRVCVTLGLSHREVQGGDEISIRLLLDAVAGLDIEVVATLDASQLDKLENVPENVRVVDFVPLNALLPTCSAILSHGGSGTLATALAHGVPQLVIPSTIWDSADKAEQLEAQGAGLYVRDVRRLSASVLRDQLLRLLDEPSFAENAARLRREMVGTPTPNDIVPLLEKLTAEHRKPTA